VNAIDANLLLTAAALIDPRCKPTADRAEAFADALWDVSIDDARSALREHQRTSDEPLLPVHVLRILAARSSEPDVTAEVVADDRARVLAAAGITEHEYLEHEHDVPWLREHIAPVLARDERALGSTAEDPE
jgi:hypothetical protein